MRARRLVSTVDLPHDEWLRYRTQSIGASDAAAALGLSRFKTPYDLYLEKTGEVEPDDLTDNEAVEIGLLAEPIIATLYERRTGRKVQQVRAILQHPEHDYVTCNLDGRVQGEDRILEKKTAGFTSHGFLDPEWGEDGTDQIPTHHFVQAQAQLAVTGFAANDVAALLAGIGFRIYTIPRDDAFISLMIDALAEFWGYVQRREPPPPTTYEDVCKRFPQHVALPIEADDAAATAYRVLVEAKQRIKVAEADEKRAQDAISSFLAEHDTLTIAGQPALTFRTQPARRFDVKSFEAAHPDLHAAFTLRSTTRVMRPTKGKNALG
jgi:putative phage-type endonuclease